MRPGLISGNAVPDATREYRSELGKTEAMMARLQMAITEHRNLQDEWRTDHNFAFDMRRFRCDLKAALEQFTYKPSPEPENSPDVPMCSPLQATLDAIRLVEDCLDSERYEGALPVE